MGSNSFSARVHILLTASVAASDFFGVCFANDPYSR